MLVLARLRARVSGVPVREPVRASLTRCVTRRDSALKVDGERRETRLLHNCPPIFPQDEKLAFRETLKINARLSLSLSLPFPVVQRNDAIEEQLESVARRGELRYDSLGFIIDKGETSRPHSRGIAAAKIWLASRQIE